MKKINLLKRIVTDLARMMPLAFFISGIYVLIAGVWEAAAPALISGLLQAMADRSSEAAARAAFIYVGGYILVQIIQIAGAVADNNGIYEKSGLILRGRIIRHASRMPFYDHENVRIQNLISRAYQCVTIEAVPNVWRGLIDLTGETVSLIGISSTLFYFYPPLVLLAGISVFPVLLERLYQGRKRYDLSVKQTAQRRKREGIWKLFMNIDSAIELHLFDIWSEMVQRWKKENQEITEEAFELERRQTIVRWRLNLLKSVSYLFSVGIAIRLTVSGRLGIGGFGACLIAFANMQKLSNDVFVRIGRVNEYLPYAADYYSFMGVGEWEEEGTEKAGELKDRIELRNVSFSYPNETKKALDQVSLTIKKGETVAIVGENGSGKTTLIKLLLGFYSNYEGGIFYDNTEYHEIKQSSLYEQFTQVAQNFVRYHLSLKENVSVSDLQSADSEQAVYSALEKGECLEILNQVGSLNRRLGREFGGIELSGGQWQRLAAARGYFRNRSIVVLDEPTSALDPNAENDFLNHLLALSEGKTAVIVSHRMNLCKKADRIIVMERGKVSETGTHESLMKKDGVYRRLYEAQQKWYTGNLQASEAKQ